MVYTYNGILLSRRKEWDFAIYGNIDGLGGHYAKRNNSDRWKTNILWHHLYVESKNIIN